MSYGYYLLPTLLLSIFTANASELEIPKSFVDGEVARADDFNANNNYLLEKLETNRADLKEIFENSRRRLKDINGSVEITVNCTNDRMALVNEYQANTHFDHLTFWVTGTCYGALLYLEFLDENELRQITSIQPMNQTIKIQSDTREIEANRAKIIPRPLTDEDGTYSSSFLLASFGSGLYLDSIDIEMGANDRWGVLYSRNSHGGLSDVHLEGHPEPLWGPQTGVRSQTGANMYINGQRAGILISGVSTGIDIASSSANITGSVVIDASSRGINSFLNGTYNLQLSSTGFVRAPEAITAGGSQIFIQSEVPADGVTIDGNVSLSNSTMLVGGGTRFSSATGVSVASSTLNVWVPGTGLTAESFTCFGPSSVNVSGIEIANQNDNSCMDFTRWGQFIGSNFYYGNSDVSSQQNRSLKSEPGSINPPSNSGNAADVQHTMTQPPSISRQLNPW